MSKFLSKGNPEPSTGASAINTRTPINTSYHHETQQQRRQHQ
jgi:hypothetical protein